MSDLNYSSLSSSKLILWAALSIFLLFLFHFESVSIGPVKVSHLWKGLLLIFLALKVFARFKLKSSVYDPLLMLSILIIFSLELVYNPLNALFTFLTIFIIPLIGIYVLKKHPLWCKRVLHFLAVFFILCFVPYELGLLNPLGEGYALAQSYGIEVQGSIGPFQTVHSASSALAGALLVLLFFFLNSTYNRVWLVFLLVLGGYLLFNTYVRTGMAMFVVGSVVMLGAYAVKSGKMFFRVLLIGIAIVPISSTWVLSNDALMARILGERTFSAELSSFETLGSGRGGLALAALEIYSEASSIEKVIGMGITQQKLRMAEKSGRAIISHNGFLDILLHQGIVGLVLFVIFLSAIWRSIGRIGSGHDVIFLRSLLAAYIVMTFFQEFDMLYMPVLLMLAYGWRLGSEQYIGRDWVTVGNNNSKGFCPNRLLENSARPQN